MLSKSVLMGIGIALLLSGAAAVLLVLLGREPDWYRKCAVPEGPERKEKAGEFQSEVGEFVDKVLSTPQGQEWAAKFEEKGINSYFEDSFISSGVAQRSLPEGISQPRIAIEPDKVRLAFRYGRRPFSTVISVDMRVWLAKERAMVALELLGLHAGTLPISAQSLRDRVTDAGRPHHIAVAWYRYNGNPVALLRFQSDRPHPTMQLQQLELHQGWILLKGRATDPPAMGAMLPSGALRPQAN